MLQTVVDQLAASHWIAFVALSAAADGSMVSRLADGICSTSTPHYARINTLVLITDPACRTVLMFEAVSFDAALSLIKRITNVSI